MSTAAFLSVSALAAGYRDGSLRPTEVVRDLATRVADLDYDLHAMIDFDPGPALAAARACEDEMSRGHDRGPLHGVPVGVKDIIDIAGTRTGCASAVTAGHIAQESAFVIQRLEDAGAIVFGKTNTHEFACGGPSFDLPWAPARNPWNHDHHPGGSSSGSGAGVAAGFFPLALGTDTGGSVRHPASACGIVGMKPTSGLVSRRGIFPLAHSLDCVGGLARTVEDAGMLLNAIVGSDPAEPSTVPAPWADCLADVGKGLDGIRIGYVRHFHEDDLVAAPEMAEALDRAAQTMAAVGATVVDIRLPPLETFFSVNRVLLSAEGFAIHAQDLRDRPADYGSLARRALLPGAFLSSEDYIAAQKLRRELIEQMEAVFAEVDVLLLASSMEPPARLDDPVETRRTYTRQARTPFSVTGNPAMTMMCGLASSGLPLSLQLAARNFDEPTLLRVAAAFEAASGFPVTPPQYSVR